MKVERAQDGAGWVAAFETADGETVEGMVGLVSVQEADRRQALIELTRLAELEGFGLTMG